MRRISHLAGTWYPADPAELQNMLAAWKAQSLVSAMNQDGTSVINKDGTPVINKVGTSAISQGETPAVILVPHAGYAYSGELATSVFAKLSPDAYDRVIILAPSHRCALGSTVSLEPMGEIVTPLGAVCFDETTHALLASLPHVGYVPRAHTDEHAVHIILPLLQYFLPECAKKSVGALVCGHLLWNETTKMPTAQLAKALRSVLDARTLVVISTDFTHYGKNFGYVPFDEKIEERLQALDQQVYTACTSNDGELFEKIIQDTKATVCGHAPLSLVLAMLPEHARWEQIAYTTSGAITGDFNHSVSYLGALVYADWQKPLQSKVQVVLDSNTTPLSDTRQGLNKELQKQVLALANKALEYAVTYGKACTLQSLSLAGTLPATLFEKRAVFVTLQKNGQLRGCIGELMPTRALAEAVVARACDAALHDTRFAPVTQDELALIRLDISVLSVPTSVDSYTAIELGTHGIILQKGQRSSVFLPHVPTEQGWDLPTTLTHLAHKAGLRPMAWQDADTVFFVFTSQLIEDV